MALKCYTPHEAWIAGSPLHLDKQTCGARRQEDATPRRVLVNLRAK